MIYIIIGMFGFIIIHTFDFVSIKKIHFGAKPIVWTTGFAILFYSLFKINQQVNTLPLSDSLTWIGWLLLAISVLMITIALFINLPFRKTYINTGVGDKLIKTGLYALVRHPGVYWVALFFFSLVFISKSQLMLIAAPIFVILNTILVVIQDIYFFPKMFKGYDKYQQETPMLIPNKRSIGVFFSQYKKSHSNKCSTNEAS
jgi:protein-S-isoprenylcysteine O-methyltransferase Ste14